MGAYYNEIDPYAAQWLRNLIKAGHIADGEVDERSIEDVRPNDLRGFTQCHFFAGIGVWSYALRLAGWPDDRAAWTGSCPCQPFSSAGLREGFADERHLWPFFYSLIRECSPSVIFGEQVAGKGGLGWLDVVQTDMESSNYAFAAANLCAGGYGAPHLRQRLFFIAHAHSDRHGLQALSDETVLCAKTSDAGRARRFGQMGGANAWDSARPPGARPVAMGNGPSDGLGELRAYGNALAAPVAQAFIEAADDILKGYDLC